MTAAATPREVVRHLLSLTAEGPAEEMADVFAVDAVFEMPFLPPGTPAQEPGREAFRAHLRLGATMQKHDSLDHVRIHGTDDDPELVVAEYRLHGRILATGKRFALDIVMFARVQDGLITWLRTYSDPLAALIAFDAAEDALAALADTA
ncbi:nuclear transport factor 2 family protein [Streptomyces sp. NPDC001315]|uniref:nuclear transport factor 2 family protein n=1 Tax=Streptomyces sp. NPDC001315 TaxID=3364562 RepID=UPI0036B687F4